MSLEALNWALYDVEPTRGVPGPDSADTYERHILLVIADQADRSGSNAVVTRAFLTDVTGFDESTIKRRLRRLRERGLIAPGDPQMVAHYPPQYRPSVWDLPHVQDRVRPRKRRSRGVSQPPPDGATGTPLARGVSGGSQRGLRGVSAQTPTPIAPTPPTTPARAGGLPPPAGTRRAHVRGAAEARERVRAARERRSGQ